MTRRALLALAPALLAPGAVLGAMGGLPRHLRDPVLGDIPICRPGFQRTQYMQNSREGSGEEADAALFEALGLLEGHMIIGRALLDAGERRLGLPHFRHPVSELYSWLEPRIAARGATPFEAELQALEARATEGATGEALGAAYAPALAGVVALRGTVAPERRANLRFRITHVAAMLGDVASDYGESIERGRIVNTLEYHDSAGFLRYAIATARSAAAEAGAAPEWTRVLAELEAVRGAAYAELLPPPRPPVSITWVRGRAARLRDIASQV